ncbi:MAG: hypothetical protein VYA19_08655 [Pseudomonadota bacterium]|nr:hypothetical protein [Pseudomonadota bacterium]MEC7442817.1 hypothetical protein [Pseudomonadota bacterium]
MTKKPFLNVLALTNMGVSSYCALRVSKQLGTGVVMAARFSKVGCPSG